MAPACRMHEGGSTGTLTNSLRRVRERGGRGGGRSVSGSDALSAAERARVLDVVDGGGNPAASTPEASLGELEAPDTESPT